MTVFGGALDISYRERNVELIHFNNLEIYNIMLGTEDEPFESDIKVLNVNVFPPL